MYCLITPVWYPTGSWARNGFDNAEKLPRVVVSRTHLSVRLPFDDEQPMSSCHRRGWGVVFDVDFKAFRVRIVTKLGCFESVMSNLSGMSTIRDIFTLSDRESVGVLIVS